jgi:ABC-2 type transport system permease protein
MRALRAELSKLLSLPFVRLACAAGLIVPVGLAVVISRTTPPGTDPGFNELAVGVLGAIILGIVAIGSEYTTEGEESAGSQQITTTLTAVPSRMRVLLAKIEAVVIATALLAVVANGAVFATVHLLLGAEIPAIGVDTLPRMGGAIAYWVLMALLGFGSTILTRNGIVPMAVLVANSSAVSATYLLALRFPAANYLPDLAGMRMFTTVRDDVVIAPVVGGLVMTAWVTALLVIAGVVFLRKDA